MEILDIMDMHGKEDERFNSYEIGRLLEYLKTLERPQLQQVLSQGLFHALDFREQTRQQRVSTEVDLTKVEDLVKSKLRPEEIEVFSQVEAISHDFSRKNKGYLHSSFLVDVTTKCILTGYDVVPFQLGAG